MNPFDMVVAIVIVVTIGGVLKARYGVHRNKEGHDEFHGLPGDNAENMRLRDEIRTLKERIQVLERVVTDNESGARIDREIEKLRDKNRV